MDTEEMRERRRKVHPDGRENVATARLRRLRSSLSPETDRENWQASHWRNGNKTKRPARKKKK